MFTYLKKKVNSNRTNLRLVNNVRKTENKINYNNPVFSEIFRTVREKILHSTM